MTEIPELTRFRMIEHAKIHQSEYVKEERIVSYFLCGICGTLKWSCASAPGEGFKVAVVESTNMTCHVCEDVARRSPEIVGWVMRVVEFQNEKASRK